MCSGLEPISGLSCRPPLKSEISTEEKISDNRT